MSAKYYNFIKKSAEYLLKQKWHVHEFWFEIYVKKRSIFYFQNIALSVFFIQNSVFFTSNMLLMIWWTQMIGFSKISLALNFYRFWYLGTFYIINTIIITYIWKKNQGESNSLDWTTRGRIFIVKKDSQEPSYISIYLR